MLEKIADKTVGMSFIQSKRVFSAWSENTRCKGLGKLGDICFVGRRKIDKSCEMRHQCIESSDIV